MTAPQRGFQEVKSGVAGIYGFTANIYFYEIDTPLKYFLVSRPNLVAHCRVVHAAIDG